MTQPTGLISDERPAWSIIDAARDITDLPLVTGFDYWRGGLDVWWRAAQINRIPIRSLFTAFPDASIANVADPAVWPEANVVIETGPGAGNQLATFPDGVKLSASPTEITRFRPFRVYAPSVELELMQGTGPGVGQDDAHDQAVAIVNAHITAGVVAEFADSLTTKNPGLYRTAVDQSGPAAVDMAVAIATLYEAHGRLPAGTGPDNDLSLTGGSGDARLTVPYHAIPGLVERNLARWQGGRLIDCYGNPVITGPGYVGRGPLTVNDPDVAVDLESSVAPAEGEGWFYISHAPYVAVGPFMPAVEGEIGRNAPRGAHAKANEAVGLAEAPAIVVFRPERVFAVNTVIDDRGRPGGGGRGQHGHAIKLGIDRGLRGPGVGSWKPPEEQAAVGVAHDDNGGSRIAASASATAGGQGSWSWESHVTEPR
jgi:hypothetical protein